MRLPTLASIGLAALGAAALSGPALAHGSHKHSEPMPPMAMDHNEVPPLDYDGPDGPMPYPDHGDPYASGAYSYPHHPDGPMPGPWMGHCGDHAQPAGCAPYPYGYPMMSYAVPMMMVPVLRQKPCPEEEVVEEWIEEEPAPVRRRTIAPRPVKEKRVKVAPAPDKRVPMAPEKRVPDKRIPY